MVSVLTWVLLGLVLYSLVAMWFRTRGLLPANVNVSGPLTTLHTKRGKAFLDWLAGPKRFWRAYANVGLGVALVIMALSFVFFLLGGVLGVLSQSEPTALNEPRNALVIPVVNQFIPLSVTPYVVVGLAVGLIIHEGGHGLMCRVEDIDIESMGLVFLAVLPMGAFVEPDEESREAADRGAQSRMFAAGVTNNFLIGFVAFALLLGPVAGSIALVQGVPVEGALPGGAAAHAGIGSGDVIQSVDGVQVSDMDELDAVLANTTARNTTVTLRDGGETTVTRKLVVQSAPPDSPIPYNSTITAVNGTAVYTEAGFRDAVRDRPMAALETREGTVTIPTGALVRVLDDGPLADAGVSANSAVVTSFDGERVLSMGDLQSLLDETSAGQSVSVTASVDGRLQTYDVTLGEDENDDTGFLGVALTQRGITGLLFSDFGVDSYPAGFFLSVLGGDGGGTLSGGLGIQLYALFMLPFMALVPGIGVGFPGFVDLATNFYVAQGPLAFLGTGGVFALANVLFWTGWINVVVGQFNLIPAFPLDGGHILRTSTEAVVSRLPVDRKRALTKAVTITVGLTMLVSILLAIFGPRLFG